MHPLHSHMVAQLRAEVLHAEAASRRAAVGAAPLAPWSARLAHRRQRVGYVLIEAGLRLAVGRVARRPAADAGRPRWAAAVRR